MERIPFLTKDEFCLIVGINKNCINLDERFEAFEKCLERVHAVAVQHALVSFPDVIVNLLRTVSVMNKGREEFLAKNKDVMAKPQEFAAKLSQVEEDDPTMDYGEMLNTAAEMVRQDIKATRLNPDTPRRGLKEDEIDRGVKEALSEAVRDEDK